MKKLSFIIPCYGSEKTITPVITEIKNTVSENPMYDYEIIAINDQSPDNVWEVLKSLARYDDKIKIASLAKNMNRPGTIMAGLSFATGDYVILMDDDGQCPMNELWNLINPLENGHDVSIAKYPIKKQSLFKNFGSFINKKMTEIIIEKPANLQFSNFTALQPYIVKEILKYKNPYPYMTGLILRTTSDIVNVTMEERERICGNTNFTFRKMLKLWFNGFTAFSVKPLRLSTIFGFIMALIGFIYGLYIIIYKLFIHGATIAGYSSIMSVLLFVSGMLMIMLGLIGEYIGRIYICINDSPQYVIKEKYNFNETMEDLNEKIF